MENMNEVMILRIEKKCRRRDFLQCDLPTLHCNVQRLNEQLTGRIFSIENEQNISVFAHGWIVSLWQCEPFCKPFS